MTTPPTRAATTTSAPGQRAHYYLPVDGAPVPTFAPSGHVQGAWRTDEQHMAPVAGLLAHAISAQQPRPDLTLARLTFDILGVIALAQTEVTPMPSPVVRPTPCRSPPAGR